MASSLKNTVFVDTSFLKSLFDPRDDFYPQSRKTWTTFCERGTFLLTTNYVLDEFFTLIRIRRGRETLKKVRQDLVVTKNIKIVRVTIVDEARAWKWIFENWSDLSFTDCVSFAVMERLGLEKVASFDQHFVQAGFKIEKDTTASSRGVSC